MKTKGSIHQRVEQLEEHAAARHKASKDQPHDARLRAGVGTEADWVRLHHDLLALGHETYRRESVADEAEVHGRSRDYWLQIGPSAFSQPLPDRPGHRTGRGRSLERARPCHSRGPPATDEVSDR